MADKAPDPFSNDVLAKAVKNLPDLPADTVTGGLTLDADGKPIAEVTGEKELGKGFFAEGDVQYKPLAPKAGRWSLAALIGWRKK